jgi:hypothetical protein
MDRTDGIDLTVEDLVMQSGLNWFGIGSRFDDAKWIALVWARV